MTDHQAEIARLQREMADLNRHVADVAVAIKAKASAWAGTPQQTTEKGPQGCPVTVWDGPYPHRCGLGASVGRCAYHGSFDQSSSTPAESEAAWEGGPTFAEVYADDSSTSAEPRRETTVADRQSQDEKSQRWPRLDALTDAQRSFAIGWIVAATSAADFAEAIETATRHEPPAPEDM